MEREVLARGTVVGGAYRVEGPLGRGGMGAVLRATDLRAGRPVALKVLVDGSATAGSSRAARFAREAELVARLDAVPGVVKVHARGDHHGLPWFAMELVEGEDLERRLARGPLAQDDALALVEALARTLAECHALGVVHRDLKPANVLLGPAGPKVADFGLARLGADATGVGARFTRTGEVVGTPAFMAPEQLDPAATVDARADVYALGALLYQALTGEPVVTATTLPELMAQLVAGAPPPSRRAPGLSPDVDAVVLTALATRPDDRYPSAAALADDLRALRGGSRVSTIDPAARARRRLASLLARGAAVVLVAALALGVGLRLRAGRRAGARAADAAALEGHRAWTAVTLERWRLGLGPGLAPGRDELARRASELRALAARAQERDGGADEVARGAAGAAARLDEVARCAAGVVAGGGGRAGKDAFGRVVDAVLARAAGDLAGAAALAEGALGQEPLAADVRARLWSDALLGGDPAEWRALGAWLAALERRPGAQREPERAVREAARAALGPAVAGRLRAAPDHPDPARGLAELIAAGRSALGLDPAGLVAAVASDKVAALEASAPVWLARAGGAVGVDALPLVRRLGAVASTEPRVLAGPALRAAQEALLRPTLEAWTAARGDRRRELGRAAARLDAQLVHDVDARRPVPPALREVSLELLLAGPPTPDRAEELLLVVRCSDGVDPFGPAKRLGAEGCRAVRAAWPRSRGARILELLISLEEAPATATGDPRLADLEAALAGDEHGPGPLDLSPRVLAEALVGLARQQAGLHATTRDPALRDAAMASAALARAQSPDPWVWRSAYEVELPLVCGRSRPDGWRALEAAAAHFEAALAATAAAREDGHAEAVCLARILNLAAVLLPTEPGGDLPVADRAPLLAWARRSLAHVSARRDCGNDEEMLARYLLLAALRHTATPEALDEAEAVAAATPAQARSAGWSIEWVLVALARDGQAAALERLAEARRLFPGEDALSALEERLAR